MEVARLVKKAQKGDKEALLTLIMTKKTDLYKLAFVYMKSPDEAQDALEDMIVIVYEKIHTLRKRSAFEAWCRQILVNCCKKKLTENKRIVYGDIVSPSDDGGMETMMAQLEIDYFLDKLSEGHRDVIRLRYLMDYDLKTVASILDIPLGTVKSRLSNGMATLKSLAKEAYDEIS